MMSPETICDLLTQHEDMIIGAVISITKTPGKGWHIRNLDDEDLIQEGRIAAVSAFRSYDPERGAALGGYLYQCVRNHLIHILSKSQAICRTLDQVAVSMDEPINTDDGPTRRGELEPDPRMNVECQVVEAVSLDQAISGALNALGDDYRVMFDLYAQEFSPTEIAERLGVSYQVVTKRLRTVRQAIKEQWLA